MTTITVIPCTKICGKSVAPGEAYMAVSEDAGFLTFGINAKRRAQVFLAAEELLAACKHLQDRWEHNLTEPMQRIAHAVAKAEAT